MSTHDLTAANHSAELFRHISAEKAVFYRRIMDVFAAAKRVLSRLGAARRRLRHHPASKRSMRP